MKFKTDDIILYGVDSICKICDETEREIGGNTYGYFVLKPVFNEKSTIYVPKANQNLIGRMKEIITSDCLEAELAAVCSTDVEWVVDDGERKEYFKAIVENGDVNGMLTAIKAICIHRDEQYAENKKLHVSDERLLKEAEKIILDLIMYSFGEDKNTAEEILKQKLNIEI